MADGIAVARASRGPGARAAPDRAHPLMRTASAPGVRQPRSPRRQPGSRRSSSDGRRDVRPAARPDQPGSGSIGAPESAFARQPLEHVEVLPLDHRPGVVPREVLAAVPAEPRVQRSVRLERRTASRRTPRSSRNTGPALLRMHWPLQHVAAAVGEHRPAERPGLERHHRQALEVRRHDQQIGGGERVELVLVVRKPR